MWPFYIELTRLTTLALVLVQLEPSSDLIGKSTHQHRQFPQWVSSYLGRESSCVKFLFAVDEAEEVADRGQLGLPDVVSWELFGLNDDDGDTFSGEGCGGVGSTGATSDDEDSGRFGLISEYFRHGVSGNPTLKVRTTDMSKQLRSRVSY